VTEGDHTIAVANQAIAACVNAGWPIVASQDWPKDGTEAQLPSYVY